MANRLTAALAALAALLMLPAAPLHAQTPRAPSDWGLSPGGAIVSVSGATVVNGEASFSAANQSVVIDAAGAGALNVGVQGTFSGALKVQWSDKPTTGFQDGKVTDAGGTEVTTVTAPQQYVGGAFARYVRITSTSWTSGAATVTPLLRTQRFSPGGGGGGGGGAATIADGADVAQGALADAACATDNGTCTLSALVKRQNQRLTTLLGALGSPLQAGGSVSIAGTLPAFAATPTFNIGTISTIATAAAQTTGNTSIANVDTDMGAAADAACATGGSSCSAIAALKGILTAAQAATPAGNNTTGDVGSASFSAVCTTLTLPGAGGTYAIGDLVANSATAGSVVSLTCTVGRYSGGPITITRARVQTSTTGLSSAAFRAHVYTTAPTVTNGNDGVFLSPVSGHFCRLDVTLDQAFSDGATGIGVPITGASCIAKLSATTDVRVLVEARGAYAWTAAQTIIVTLEGYQ